MNGYSVRPSALPTLPSFCSSPPQGRPASPASLGPSAADTPVTELVHFAGFWSQEDETVLRRAIGYLELRLDDVPDRTLGEPWVCTCQILGRGRFYTAHRAGFEHPVTGRSVRQLAFRLFDAAHSLTG